MKITNILLAIIAVIILTKSLVWAFDTHMDNRDVMLCKSAKVSGNSEWLAKCQCYYKGEPISCLYGDLK